MGPVERRTNNDRRHATNQGKSTSRNGRGKNGLNSSNVVLRVGGVDSTKGKGGSNHGDEHEEGHSDRLLVKVGHLSYPVGTDRALEVGNQTLTPSLGRICCKTIEKGEE